MGAVLAAAAIIPSAPVLVPELAGSAAAELTDLYAAVRAAAAELPARWIAVGAAPAAARLGPRSAGTFAGYGVDVRVGLSAGADQPAELPLCALIAGWLRGAAAPAAQVDACCLPATLDTGSAAAQGRALRAEIDAAAEPVGVLVLADGCHTLSASAPGGHDPGAPAVQDALDTALADGDRAALLRLPGGVVGRSALAALAGLFGEPPAHAYQLYRGAPYGVGYFVGLWRP